VKHNYYRLSRKRAIRRAQAHRADIERSDWLSYGPYGS